MRLLRITALILALTFVFAACSTAEPEIVPEYNGDIEEGGIDLLGYEYIIAAGAHGGGRVQLLPEPGSDSRGDKLLQRYKDTEKEFNIKLTVMEDCSLSNFMAQYAAGLKYSDLIIAQSAEMVNGRYVQNGYFLPFSDMGLDFESGIYGTPGMLDVGCFDGKYYSIISYYWGLPSPYVMPAMWFNPSVISEYQQTSPHELDEQGEWVWATFEDMCEVINDTSAPDSADHVYAISNLSEPFIELGALFSNSARIVTKGSDGKLRYSLNSKNAEEALEFVKGLNERKLIKDARSKDNQDVTDFVENRLAFFMQYTQIGLASENENGLAYNMDGSYEWILFPTGPSYDPTMARTAYSYHYRYYYAPTNSDAEVHSIVLPYLFQPLPGETKEDWQDELERNNFFTKESFDYFQTIRDDAFYDYAPYIPYSDMNSNLSKVTMGSITASEALESLGQSIQSSLDKLYNDYLD